MDDDYYQPLRQCGACLELLPLDEFNRRGSGLGSWCKACFKKYDAEYYARNRARLIAQKQRRSDELVTWMRSLKAAPCVDCGGRFHPAAMTFDHLPGVEKRSDIATLARRTSAARVRAEIKKCELVCANCHAVRTFMRREANKAA